MIKIAHTGRPKIYNIEIGEIIGDYKCVGTIKDEHNYTKYIMECLKCGRRKNVLGSTFKKVKHGIYHSSCGQYIKTKNKKFYESWCAMRTRTNNPNYAHYKDYGGRGINSDCWEYFIDFYDDMYDSYLKACKEIGEKNLSLERKDVNKNYCKENCCWIHIKDQKGNQRKTVNFEITFPNGDTKTFRNVRKFAREYGYNDACIRDLLNSKLKTAYGLKGKLLNKCE